MGIEKGGSARGEAVKVRSFCEGVSPEMADPIVLIIDGNEDHIRFSLCLSEGFEQEKEDELSEQTEKGGAHHQSLDFHSGDATFVRAGGRFGGVGKVLRAGGALVGGVSSVAGGACGGLGCRHDSNHGRGGGIFEGTGCL